MKEYLDIISILVAGVALIVSVLCYFENRKTRIEHGRAYLTAEIMQINSKLYLVLSNVGNTFAYDMEIKMSDAFVNVFENLKTIRPGCSYRYCLLDNNDISTYPDIIEIIIKYHDYYSPTFAIEKTYSFKLIEYLKFDVIYDQKYSCYDIKKSF